MLSDMADVKVGTTQTERVLDATAQNTRAAQERLDGLLEVARLAREARTQRERGGQSARRG